MSEGTVITVTPDAILLQIPPTDAERASTLDGARWDSTAKTWRFPNDEGILDGLIQEFGAQLDELRYDATGAAAGFDPRNAGQQPEEETTVPLGSSLGAEPMDVSQVLAMLAQLREKLESVPTSEYLKTVVNGGVEQIHVATEEVRDRVTDLLKKRSTDKSLQATIDNQKKELTSVKNRTAALEQELISARDAHAEIEDDLKKRQSEVVELKRENQRIKNTFVQESTLSLAKALSENDGEFSKIVDSIDVKGFDHLPNILEGKIRSKIFEITQNPSSGKRNVHTPSRLPNLSDLLNELANLLRDNRISSVRSHLRDEDVNSLLNCLHFFRYRRNKLAHLVDDKSQRITSPTEILAHAIGAVIAVAIAWKNLQLVCENFKKQKIRSRPSNS